MRQSRVIQIMIIAANLVLAAVCLVAYTKEDKVKPEFMFETGDFIYYLESEETDALLQGIMAHDDRDGDITDRIVIEKITENRDSSTVVVYYAVSDSAGNVAKISRVFPAVFQETEHEEAAQAFAVAEMPNVEILENQEVKGDNAKNPGDRTDSEEDGQAEEDEDGEDAGETGEEESEEDPNNGQREEDEAENSGQEEETEDDRQAAADEAEDRRDEAADSGENAREQQTPDTGSAPVLTLKKAEVTIEAGTTPPWTEIIETLRDDKDDYATLYYNLNISRYNRNQQGDYPVTLYTEDSDGNRSGTVTVMVHVKGNGRD